MYLHEIKWYWLHGYIHVIRLLKINILSMIFFFFFFECRVVKLKSAGRLAVMLRERPLNTSN